MSANIIITVAESGAERKPFWARCGDNECRHRWPAAYLPMEMTKAAKLLAMAQCPMCGSKQVFVADQRDGVLLEEGAA